MSCLKLPRHIIGALVVLLGAVCPAVWAQTAPPRTVLIIHWGAEAFPGNETFDAAVRSALRSDGESPVNYYAEYLETEEFTSDTALTSLSEYIRRKFKGRHIDLVLANATAALQFALRYRDDLFPGVPIAFASGEIPEVTGGHRPPGVAGIVRTFAVGETLDLAMRLHPSIKRAFVIAQAPSVSGYDDRIQSNLARYGNRLELIRIEEPTVSALLDRIRAIPPDSVILYNRYTPKDGPREMYPDEVAQLVAAAAPVPVYGVTEQYVGTGVVGGMLRSSKLSGTRLGEIARSILDGMPPDRIPIGTAPLVPMFDWRQIERWGIDASKLPPQSIIQFKSPTAWEAYRWYIIGALIVFAAQLMLITALLTQRAKRRSAEGTIRTREASLQTSYERIRQLAGRLINAQEAARATIAQDLHDDVCQRLAMVSLAVDSLKKSAGDVREPATQRAFTELARETRSTVDSLRRLSHELHPATLRILGLAHALQSHCAEVERRHNVRIAFAADDDLHDMRPDVAISFFRIAQESLRNGIVHGEAQAFAVSLANSGNCVQMTVTDDGHGFDLEAVRRAGIGLGLVSIEERAHVVGGKVHIVTGVRQGTTIRVTGPAAPDSSTDASPDARGERSTAIA